MALLEKEEDTVPRSAALSYMTTAAVVYSNLQCKSHWAKYNRQGHFTQPGIKSVFIEIKKRRHVIFLSIMTLTKITNKVENAHKGNVFVTSTDRAQLLHSSKHITQYL